jgi:spermidine synthase
MALARRELFLISFLILFFELAAIRFFGSTVVFLTFFTNIVLLACFLGMSLGLLSARAGRDLVPMVLPLAMLSFAAAIATHLAYWNWAETLTVGVGDQQSAPELIYFGTEYRPADPSRWHVPIWAVAAVFFTMIALTFVGLGQVMGRAFAAIENRVAAYSIDIAGSLSGIAAFAAMSYFELPPSVWLGPIVLLMLYFAGWRKPGQLASAAALWALAALGSYGLGGIGPGGAKVPAEVYWSPYYKVAYSPVFRAISTNDIGHQQMLDVARRAPAYRLPYDLNREAGGAPFRNVMIIGAGSGNDVAAALLAGAQHVDAVEIDPRINALGRGDHPNHPYGDPRVTVHLDDGRSFVRHTDAKYDLAIYALVDSLMLHSGYSSLRLENFLFTTEAFADVRRVLAADGLFVMYNYFRQGWVVTRLATMAEQAFGTKPLVFNLPYRPEIRAQDSQQGQWTLIVAGADAERLKAIRARFAAAGSFWLGQNGEVGRHADTFGTSPPSEQYLRIAPSRVQPASELALPSDDWPHIYLRSHAIPWAPLGEGMAAVAALSFALLLFFAPLRRVTLNAQMFFLGAGFMLLETKSVVHMALLFGGTWVVNCVVFFAILVMILCANFYVLAMKPARLAPYYALLLVALLVNAVVPMSAFLALEPLMRTIVSCAVVSVPIFFAGVIFASVFARSANPDVDFGSNVAGIILGGLSEPLSLVIGFNALLIIAIAYYVLSVVLRPRGLPA